MTVEQVGKGLLRVRYDGTLIAETAPSAAPRRRNSTFPARSPWTRFER